MIRPDAQKDVLLAVRIERTRQERLVESGKFPYTCADQSAPDAYKLAVLVEEVGEVAKALLVNTGDKGASGDLREELVEVAAVAVAWAESIP